MSDKTMEATNSILKGLLTDAVVDRGWCSDIDSALTPGCYLIAGAQGIPDSAYKYGLLAVFAQGIGNNTHCIVQVYFPEGDRRDVYIRCIWSGQTRAWRRIATEALAE